MHVGHAFPWSTTHLCSEQPESWRRYQNSAGEPGSCNRRIYAQHICSCNTKYENRRRTKNEQLHSYGDVRSVTNLASRSTLSPRSYPSLFPFCPLCTAFIFKTKKFSVFKGFRPQRKHWRQNKSGTRAKAKPETLENQGFPVAGEEGFEMSKIISIDSIEHI